MARTKIIITAIIMAITTMILSSLLTRVSNGSRDHRAVLAKNGNGNRTDNYHHHHRRRLARLDPFRDPKTVEKRTHVHEHNPIRNNEPDTTNNMMMMIQPYTIHNAILSLGAFKHLLFFFVYNASSDTFIVIHNAGECTGGCRRIHVIAPILSYALRKNFPERFRSYQQQQSQQQQQQQHDFVVMITCGDNPSVKNECLLLSETNNNNNNYYCQSADFAPVLHFGSVFANTAYLPSLVVMPPPVMPHLPCFHEWQIISTTEEHGVVCDALQPPVHDNDFTWDRLIPQVIWRGTDFGFLNYNLLPGMRAPDPKSDILWNGRQFTNEYEKKQYAIESLLRLDGDVLLPRWRGVLMTSLAELEVSEMMMMTTTTSQVRGGLTNKKKPSDRPPRQEDRQPPLQLLPWLDIKFSHIAAGGKKVSAGDEEQYRMFEDLGIVVSGDVMSSSEQANYRYHIDLGGGSGTTWTGTLQKLALPGVLFHHVTPAKDWYHDLLVPWEHYIPINMDLSDLREKYEWAESHPNEARQISENGTRFVQWMASEEGFGQLYDNYLVAPLRNVINAYDHPSPAQHGGENVMEIINGMNNGDLKIVAKCDGMRPKSCSRLA